MADKEYRFTVDVLALFADKLNSCFFFKRLSREPKSILHLRGLDLTGNKIPIYDWHLFDILEHNFHDKAIEHPKQNEVFIMRYNFYVRDLIHKKSIETKLINLNRASCLDVALFDHEPFIDNNMFV